MEVEVDHHLHDERHVGLVRLEDSVEDAAAQHRRSRAGDRPGVVQAKAREETLLGVVPVERFGANQGGVVDESALRSVVRARTDVGIDGVGFVGTGPRRGAGALRGANGHVHRRVQARREVSKKRPSLDGVAGEIVVVGDVKVRERAMQVKTCLLTAGGLAEYAHDRNLEEEVVGWRGMSSRRGRRSRAGGVPTSALAPRAHLVHGGVTEEGRVGDVEPGHGFGHVVVDGHESNLERVARPRVRVARGGGAIATSWSWSTSIPTTGGSKGAIPKVTPTSRDQDAVSHVR